MDKVKASYLILDPNEKNFILHTCHDDYIHGYSIFCVRKPH